LSNIEKANKILLGALFNQTKMHPVDYVYEALNLQIEYLGP
jgi:poly [ADP-ribose] polymerase